MIRPIEPYLGYRRLARSHSHPSRRRTIAEGRAIWVGHFMRGDMAAGEKAFMSCRNPAEIVERRKAEAELLLRGVWSNDGTIPEYTKLTKKMTPVWSSRARVDVSKELVAAFAGVPEPDATPRPNAKPATPTLSPPTSSAAPEPKAPAHAPTLTPPRSRLLTQLAARA